MSHKRSPNTLGLTVLFRTIAVWRHRSRSRRELAGLDVRLLHDIGLDPYEAEREANKPFWRA